MIKKTIIRYSMLAILAMLAVACKQASSSDSSILAAKESAIEGETRADSGARNQALQNAFEQKQSDIFLEGEGVVKKLLPDDNKGARHQKFLVSISEKQTLLFAHNIDLAPRIEDIQVGNVVTFRGEYVYNPKGGVIHWTHHDPQGHKPGGWIKHNGKTYQ